MIRKLFKFLHLTEQAILVASSTFCFIGICIAVFLRYFLRKDLFGLEELLMIAGFWLYFIGGAYGSYTRTQITADLVDFLVKNKRVAGVIRAISLVFSIAMSAFLFWLCIGMMRFGISAKAHTPVFNLPMVMAHLPLVAGFFLMTCYTVYELVDKIREILASPPWASLSLPASCKYACWLSRKGAL